MSTEIYRNPSGTMSVTSYCGPELEGGLNRMRLQFNADQPFPENTLGVEEVMHLWIDIQTWLINSANLQLKELMQRVLLEGDR